MTQSVSAGRSYCSPGAFVAHICHFIARKATTRLSSARSHDAPKRLRLTKESGAKSHWWVSDKDRSDSQATISPWEALRGHLRINNYHRGFKLYAVSANISELKPSGRSTTRCLMALFPHRKRLSQFISTLKDYLNTISSLSGLHRSTVLRRLCLLYFSFKDYYERRPRFRLLQVRYLG